MEKVLKFTVYILLILISHCSFDNKSGIWNSQNSKNDKKNEVTNTKLEDVFVKNKSYKSEKNVDSNYLFNIEEPIRNKNWKFIFQNTSNNLSHVYYHDKMQLLLVSKKLSKNIKKPNMFIEDDNIIYSDNKGNIFVYSSKLNIKVFSFNFYKKKYKKSNIKIYLAIKDNIIYAADNLGYTYALDFKLKKLLWAKELGIPFRSNIMLHNNQMFVANQDNNIYSLNTINGSTNWNFATDSTRLKASFENSIIVDDKNNNVFFLNASGILYSINYNRKVINWIINLQRSNISVENEIYEGQPISLKKDKIVVTGLNNLYSFNSLTGQQIWKQPVTSSAKVLQTENNIFLISNENLLICLDSVNGNIVWSQNIFRNLNSKKYNLKRTGQFRSIFLVNYKIFLFSDNGYLLSFDYKNGSIKSVHKISKKGLDSYPIFSDGFMFVVDNKKRLLKFE
jgi:outer membrane protein assembly factor BamB|tara:strand:+ start:6665 stop:8014 length:1350 start_codon:yes stop_codon:yes gene_type:complete